MNKQKIKMYSAIAALFAGVLLVACQPQQDTPQYTTYNDAKANHTKVHVLWQDDPDKMCKIVMGSYTYATADFLGCTAYNEQKETCTIIMPKPKDFNDKTHLTILGHELMHCFGASHE